MSPPGIRDLKMTVVEVAELQETSGDATVASSPLGEGDRTRILYPGYGGRLPQRTIVNKRCQRTDHGQRHTCQACAPSPIEKKMISARPMMFSNGT